MANRRSPTVSIVILNWNGIEDTVLCLDELKKQTFRDYEVIVVDNGSRDDSLKILQSRSDIRLIENQRNLGFTGGHITGLAHATGKYILLVNNDAVLDKDYLKIGVDYLEDNQDVAVLGGRAYLWDDKNPLKDKENSFYSYQNINPITAEGIFATSDEGMPREANNVSGSSVFVRRATIDKVGYLCNRFFAYYEESDLFARIKRSGQKVVYHPNLAIWHQSGKSANKKGSSFSLYMMMRNRFAFAVRNFESLSMKRFLRFYIKNGVKCCIVSIIPGRGNAVSRAYAKAFLYNVVLGWRSFKERVQLDRQLGASDYNAQIVREQTIISNLMLFENQASRLSHDGQVWDETIVVLPQEKKASLPKEITLRSHPLRYCVDRRFFQTHPQNLGLLAARGDWVRIPLTQSFISKYLGGAGNFYHAITSERVVFYDGSHLYFKRDFILRSGGFYKDASISDATLAILLATDALGISDITLNSSITPTDATLVARDYCIRTWNSATPADASKVDLFLSRHLRAEQALSLLKWYLNPQISTRLKLARTKNLLLSAATLNRKSFALELKHITNQVRKLNIFTDTSANKQTEAVMLDKRLEFPAETPLFIITRDRNDALQQLLKWIKGVGITRVVLVDNDSIYPPLIEYLERSEYQVIETLSNVGHTVLWSSSFIKLLAPDEFYIVTDPDVMPVSESIEVIKRLYEAHEQFPHHLKAGLALKIDDLPDHYKLSKSVKDWEKQFWKVKLADDIYEAGVDTTFALYKPFTYNYFLHPSIRVAGHCEARHLPWYANSSKRTQEDLFYQLRADPSVNSWDSDNLPDRYVQELKKHK